MVGLSSNDFVLHLIGLKTTYEKRIVLAYTTEKLRKNENEEQKLAECNFIGSKHNMIASF